MIITKFEDIIAWKKSQDFAVEIYLSFKDVKDYSLKDQLFRSVISISNNIAEGFDRNSDLDFNRFLMISKSSCNETKSMLYLAARLGLISQEKKDLLLSQAEEIQKIITGLSKSLKRYPQKAKFT